MWGYVKFGLLQDVTRDVTTHDSVAMRAIHAHANKYDLRVEHLWTYCQVASAMMMSIVHGSNDMANAVGPWTVVYQTYQEGEVATESPTSVWFLVVAGFLLGAGFWFYDTQYGPHCCTYANLRDLGYKIMRAWGLRLPKCRLVVALLLKWAQQSQFCWPHDWVCQYQQPSVWRERSWELCS